MPAISVSPWASLLFLSALFLALASILSSAPSGAYYFVALLAFQIFAIFIVFTLLRELPRDVLTEMAVGLALGWSIAVLIFTLEFLTGGLMQVYFKGLLPDFLLTKRPVIDQRLNDFEFNRSVAIIALLAWVALAASLVLPLRNNIRLAVYAVVPIAASIIIESSHKTSKIALIISAAVFALSHIAIGTVRRIILVAILGSGLFVIPIMTALERIEAYDSPYLGASLRHRIVIWGFTAEQYWKSPWIGAGIFGGRSTNDKVIQNNAGDIKGKDRFLRSTDWHSHNVYLQAWYETGAFGGLLLLAVIMIVWRNAQALAKPMQPYVNASFGVVLALTWATFGLWSLAHLSMYVIAAIFAYVASLALTEM